MARRAKVETDSYKPRKRRKPMTAEQKAAAAERLALAREKRAKANPPKYTNIHPSVVARPEDDAMSMKNVQRWIKTQKELLSVAKSDIRRKVKGAEIYRVASHEGYIRNLQRYLRDGDYCMIFGVNTNKTKYSGELSLWRTTRRFTKEKRRAHWYPDIGCVWTRKWKRIIDGK